MTRTPEEAVRGLWRTLSARDYDGISDWVTDDCIYLDMTVITRIRIVVHREFVISGHRHENRGEIRSR